MIKRWYTGHLRDAALASQLGLTTSSRFVLTSSGCGDPDIYDELYFPRDNDTMVKAHEVAPVWFLHFTEVEIEDELEGPWGEIVPFGS